MAMVNADEKVDWIVATAATAAVPNTFDDGGGANVFVEVEDVVAPDLAGVDDFDAFIVADGLTGGGGGGCRLIGLKDDRKRHFTGSADDAVDVIRRLFFFNDESGVNETKLDPKNVVIITDNT